MANPSTVKELFLPLAERLDFFESKEYIHNSVAVNNYTGEIYHDAAPFFRAIRVQSNLFDGKEVYHEATLLLPRVRNVLETLEPTKTEIVTSDDHLSETEFEGGLDVREVDPSRQAVLFERNKAELIEYEKGLTTIIKLKESEINAAKPLAVEPVVAHNQGAYVIELAADFKVREITKYFKGKLSVEQAALLLNYLQDKELIPNYSANSKGRIAELLFASSGSDVRKKVTEVQTIDVRKDLKVLSLILQDLLESIQKDMQTN